MSSLKKKIDYCNNIILEYGKKDFAERFKILVGYRSEK